MHWKLKGKRQANISNIPERLFNWTVMRSQMIHTRKEHVWASAELFMMMTFFIHGKANYNLQTKIIKKLLGKIANFTTKMIPLDFRKKRRKLILSLINTKSSIYFITITKITCGLFNVNIHKTQRRREKSLK